MLSFEEFKQKYMRNLNSIGEIDVDPELTDTIQELHGIDINTELENSIRKEYEFYLKLNAG